MNQLTLFTHCIYATSELTFVFVCRCFLYLIIGTLGNHNRFLFIANGFPHNRKLMFVIPTLLVAPDLVGIDRHLLNLIVSPDRYEFIIEDKESLFGEINLNVFSLLSFIL